MLKFIENLYEVRTLRKNVCYVKNSVMYFKWAFPTGKGGFNLTYTDMLDKKLLKEILAETKNYKTVLTSSLRYLDKKYPEFLEKPEETIIYGLVQTTPFSVNEQFVYKLVQSKEDLLLWGQLASQVYTDYDADFIFESFKTDIRKKYASYFIFYEKGKPVGVSQVIRGAGYSAVYWVGVLEQYRKKGFGTELTKCTLNYEIKHKRCRFLLSATEVGLKIYQKLGFKASETLYEYPLR